jgi:hypothetical protein
MSSVRRREAEHILKLCLGDHLRAYQLVERQLSRLINRAQVMVSVSALIVAATGFSGKAIAQTSEPARMCVAGGVLILVIASAMAVTGVLRLRWLSQEIDDEPVVTLLRGLEVRDRKAENLRRAIALFVVGFVVYCAAIAQFLLASRPQS